MNDVYQGHMHNLNQHIGKEAIKLITFLKLQTIKSAHGMDWVGSLENQVRD